jgi:hypothetical protein
MASPHSLQIKRRGFKHITVAAYVDATWWAVALLSIAGACSSDTIHLWIAATSTLLSVWALLPFSERWLWVRPRFFLLLFIALLCSVQGLSTFLRERDVLILIGDCLAGFLPVAIFRRNSPLGYWLAFLVAFLLALGGVVAEGELNAYFFFIVFLGVGAANLNAAHLLQLTGPSQARIQTLAPRYFRQFATSALAGFAFGAFIFFAFPREYSWTNPWGMRQKNRTLGFTTSIALDGSSVTADSTALAFTVASADPAFLALYSKDLYFRGTSVDTFDGIHWTGAIRRLHYFNNKRDNRTTSSHNSEMVKLRIYREASNTANLFYPAVMRSLDIPWARVSAVSSDQSGNLSRIRVESIPFMYEVWISSEVFPTKTAPIKEIAKTIRDWDADGDNTPFRPSHDQLETDLLVPESIKSAEYFQKWMREVPVDPKRDSLFTVFNKLKVHFKQNFKATLTHEMDENKAFEIFLSSGRKGHCEYFVTAAALFLRMNGIPARPVLGYFGSTFNFVSGVAEVRETNAHAWLEVFYPGSGWFTFDPTPLTPVPSRSGLFQAAFDRVASYYSAARFWFNEYIADYNGRTQIAMLQSFSFHRQDRKLATIPTKQWLSLALMLIAGVIAYLFFKSRERRKKTHHVPGYYRTFLWKLEREGFERKEGESYRAFHQRLIQSGLHSETVKEVGNVIEIDLYSKYRTQSQLRKRITRLIRANMGRVRKVS